MKPIGRNVNVKKVSTIAIVTNALQVGLVVGMVLYVLLVPHAELDTVMAKYILVIAASVVVWGAVVDIREALSTRRLLGQLDDMDSTIEAMESLNNTLRAQRHDFLNHLQVVYSLMEMEEYGEANAYIEKVYGAITAVSRVMKTANPAINALLQVKLAACDKAGVQAEVNIQSAWKDLPVPGWEMCKVLSNLIDNALDALEEVEPVGRRLRITLTEDLRSYRFSVANTGPMIPLKSQKAIFGAGITTKAAGHGMGLFIVKKTLNDRGGDIDVTSSPELTEFSGWVPKEIAPVAVSTEADN